MNDRLNQSFRLKDGRNLGFAELGDPNGIPVFYFHGYAGARTEPLILELLNKKINCRLISIDRPGMGLSDFKNDRTVLEWPEDIIELADHLGLSKFHILGVSGGGPYAAVCAYKIPERIITVGVVGGVAPYSESKKYFVNPNKILFKLLKKLPFLIKLSQKQSAKLMKKPERLNKLLIKQIDLAQKTLPKPDADLYKDEKMIEYLKIHFNEIFRQGYRGSFEDGLLQVKPWGFELTDILESVEYFVWHGELDKNVPIGIGKYVASSIKHSKAKFYPGEAHLSTLVNKFEEIIDTLTN